jgi:hypothetical protein
MNFFVKPKEQSETRFGFALARKSLLKTNFSINQAFSSSTNRAGKPRLMLLFHLMQ